MQFNEKMKMAELIHQNYLLLPILNRFDIKLGFGDHTIREICKEQGINTDFFLVIVNSFNDHNYFPQDHLLSFPLSLIMDYIQKSHAYYLDVKVPQIEKLIKELIEHTDKSRLREISMVEKFFSDYKSELIEHIREEEDHVYPYVMDIDNAYNTGQIEPRHIKAIRKNPIARYEEGHTNVEDKLFDLKNILIKYLPPISNYMISNALLIEIFRLERDLNDHARIEEKVLVPKVQFIENQILNRQ